jgi:hypothetical protein
MIVRCALRAAALVASLTVGAATARAQSPIKLGIAGGASLPIGNTADVTQVGYNGTVTVALNAPLIPIGLRVDGMFNQLRGKELLAGVDGPDLSVSSVNANLTYTLLPLPIARLYLIGGAGYYRAEFKDSGVDPENKVGYNGGVGLRIGTGGAQTFVEARYHRVKLSGDEKLEFVPITIGFLF